MIFAPGDALTKEVDDDLGEAGSGDGGAGFGHPMDDQKEDGHEEPGDGGELPDDDQNINDPPPEAGNATEYPAEEGSAMLGVQLPVDGNNPPVQENPQRHISDESVVGPFQLSNDVGDHPACALDASQDFDKQLTVQPPGQEIVLSPSSEFRVAL